MRSWERQPIGRRGRRGPPRRRGQIVLSLLAVLVVVGVVPLASVAWKLIDLNREALTTSTQQYQLLLATAAAREVEVHVDAVRARLPSIAAAISPIVARGGREAIKDLSATLQANRRDDLKSLQFTALDDRVVTSVPADASLPEPVRETVRAGADAVREIAERGSGAPAAGVWISEPVLLEGDRLDAVLVVATPVMVDGKVRGALTAEVSFGSIWERIAGRMRTGQTLFAIDAAGRPFASSRPDEVWPGMDLGGSEIVNRFRESGRRASESRPFEWNLGDDRERYLGSYWRTEQGWGIVVQAEESKVYAPVDSMIDSTLSWVLAAFALAALAAMVFARTLSTPINRLAAASRAFAEGQFSSRVEIRSNNEIGELADTFNRMAREIETRIRELDRKAQENNELFHGTIRALANAIDAKDPYTRGHSERVNKYARIIARRMALSDEDLEAVDVASVLHDVGKIGIDDAILKKPGALTREEFEIMKTHTTWGADIMAPIGQMQRFIPGLRHHHERWNGTGYPDGLTGEQIPLMGRIIAVADTFDAMTTNRPYQRAFTFVEAVARINELKGLAFDESAVEAFNRAYVAGEFGAAPDLRAEHPSTAAAV